MLNVLSLLLALSLSSFLVGCKNAVQKDLSSDSGTTPSTVTPGTSTASLPTPTPASPFSLSLFTTYTGTTFNNQLIFAETGSSSCVATATAPVITCTVAVPEGRLYYSDLSISFAWLPSSCRILTFRPYSYMRSISATYVPPGASSTVDCSGATIPVPGDCYGGPAKTLVPGYALGSVMGLTYVPDETILTTPNTRTLLIPSGASAATGSNRQTVNDMPGSKVANSYTSAQMGGAGDGYVANTYSNYQFTCRDDWFDSQSYVINLNVTDIDSAVGNTLVDQIYTFKELP